VQGRPVARQTVYFVPARELKLSDPRWQTRLERDPAGGPDAWRLAIRTPSFARAVWIDFGPLEVELADNALDIPAGEEVLIPLRTNASQGDLQAHLNLRSLADSRLR